MLVVSKELVVSVDEGIDISNCVVLTIVIGTSIIGIDTRLVKSVSELVCAVLKFSGPGSMGAGPVSAIDSMIGTVLGKVRVRSIIGVLGNVKGK